MEILKSIFLGGVQGIAEFLPISSSGHLVVFPYILDWDYKGLSFDIALHFGTAIAIMVYFWKDWKRLITSAISKLQGTSYKVQEDQNEFPQNLLWQIVVASIPAGIIGVLINDYVESKFHSPLLIAFNLIFFGLVLWFVDKYSKTNLKIKNAKYWNSFLIGIAQSIALMPGVSRSGITITTSRLLGFEKEDGAKLSFMIGTPAMLGAFVLAAKDMKAEMINVSFIIAVIASAIFGYLAIKYMLKYLQKGSFAIFTWYRIVLGAIIILIYLSK